MMQREVPRARSAKREPAQHEPRIVDLESALHGSRRLEHVDLACPVVGVVSAREHLELKLAGIPRAGVEGFGAGCRHDPAACVSSRSPVWAFAGDGS